MAQNDYLSASDFPETIPVFPLDGALLFPRWSLPLNIFEPRYLNMIDDAMAGHRLIGMIQTTGGDKIKPSLANVGCVGQISKFSETDDGRYIIVLEGVSRFEVVGELDEQTPYRVVKPAFDPFEPDLMEVTDGDLPDRDALIDTLEAYLSRNQMKADWESIQQTPVEPLINALCSGCPFSVVEKQALVEAKTLKDRCDTLITLLEMDLSDGQQGSVQ